EGAAGAASAGRAAPGVRSWTRAERGVPGRPARTPSTDARLAETMRGVRRGCCDDRLRPHRILRYQVRRFASPRLLSRTRLECPIGERRSLAVLTRDV